MNTFEVGDLLKIKNPFFTKDYKITRVTKTRAMVEHEGRVVATFKREYRKIADGSKMSLLSVAKVPKEQYDMCTYWLVNEKQ